MNTILSVEHSKFYSQPNLTRLVLHSTCGYVYMWSSTVQKTKVYSDVEYTG